MQYFMDILNKVSEFSPPFWIGLQRTVLFFTGDDTITTYACFALTFNDTAVFGKVVKLRSRTTLHWRPYCRAPGRLVGLGTPFLCHNEQPQEQMYV